MPMNYHKKTTAGVRNRILWAGLIPLVLCALFVLPAGATDIETTPRYTFVGNVNFVGTGGSLRTRPNAGWWADPCRITTTSTEALSGIPAGATIRAAYLYWARSGNAADNQVSLNGNTVNADRPFDETFVNGGTTYRFFSGMADVTSIVNTTRNGNYTFGGLTISAGNPWCGVQAVVGGWALVVIYEDASEKERVINIYDGFQYFRDSDIVLTPSNFVVSSASGIDGKIGHISWEGDPTLTGANEYLRVNGTTLTDASNSATDQYNSTFSHLGTLVSSPTYGVDFDIYDISSLLSEGDSSLSSVYSAAGDLVILSAEIISVTCQAADLSISKTHSGGFVSGGTGDFTITVTNSGPNSETGTVTVTDVLPAGLTYSSFSGTGWAVDTSGAPTIVFTYDCSASPLPPGNSLPALTLTVNVGAAAVPNVSNTASVDSDTTFDPDTSDNSDTDTVTVSAAAPDLLVMKTVTTFSDPTGGANPKAIPGAVMIYTIQVTNQGAGPVDADSINITDAIPANTKLFVGDLGDGPIVFLDGSAYGGTDSGLDPYDYIALDNDTDDLGFSSDNGATFTYHPTPDGDDCDENVTDILVNPKGPMDGAASGNTPSFQVRFRVQVE
ncbi:DUF11 domain-containing protein [Desulfosudis oleivorans]|uniref:Conserved repeat domain n=1 Tax=Desulfosudis oleivorans (strain DSM 6200 / JCM 39069 / Hxd3) TaxID=96561 RepID=A9A0P1_DESOH|nr:DUF11 domain-containing protein [Desulfosudis oleivorans]ABW69058.1 conserved repeat domain [Desulfosudis oleivorans Hxd3]